MSPFFLLFFLYELRLGSLILKYQADMASPETSESYANFTDLLENLENKSKTQAYRVFTDENESIWDNMNVINEFSDLKFSCLKNNFHCSISARPNSTELVIIRSNLTFSGFVFKITKENGPPTGLMTLVSASAHFLNCKFENKVIYVDGVNVFFAEKSLLSFSQSSFQSIIRGQKSSIIKARDNSRLLISDAIFEETIISADSELISLEISHAEISGCNISNFNVTEKSAQKEARLYSMISLRNTKANLQIMGLKNISLTDADFITILNGDPTQNCFIDTISIQNFSSIGGQLLSVVQAKGDVSITNIYLKDCFFVGVYAFYFAYVKPSLLIIANVSLFEVYFELCFRVQSVAFAAISNVHLFNTYSKANVFTSEYASDSFLLADNFFLMSFHNCSIDGYLKRLPALIFRITSLEINGKVSILKCSFKNTLINNNSQSELGIIHGGVLSFDEISEVYINDTIFKNNTIKLSKSIMGSAAIYFVSQGLGHSFFISNCLFISNQVLVGPYVMSSFSYRFALINSFVGNTSYLEKNGPLGLALIKVASSLISIEQLKTFNNSFTDGLINIIESFTYNRVLVRNWTAICNMASKRGAGSLLLDGSSKNRVVLLENSLFVNNTALTQNAVGIHMFHTTLFIVLNVTYSKCKFYLNFATLGTSWWLRVAKKDAYLSISDCDFHASETFRRPSDWAVAYSIGAEKGSVFIVRNCFLNESLSSTYGFYVKDLLGSLISKGHFFPNPFLKAIFDNVTITNQTTLARYSSLFKVEGVGMIFQNCLILNQTSKSIFFNVRDNATLEIINSTIWNVKTTECWFFGVTKSRVHVINTVFYNISIDTLFKLLSSGEELPNVIENCVFVNITTDFITSLYSSIIMVGNKLSFLNKSIFSIDSSSFLSQNDKITDISCTLGAPHCILKASGSTIIINQTQVAKISSSIDGHIYNIKDCDFRLDQSKFGDVYSKIGKGLINSKNTDMTISLTEFSSLISFIANTYRGISTILNSNFIGFDQKAAEMSFFFYHFEPKSVNISGNKFKRAILAKAAITIIGSSNQPPPATISNNYFEAMESPEGEGSCLNTNNVDLDFDSNVFLGNKAKIGGAAYVYCDFSHANRVITECSWNLTNNTFQFNKAALAAGAIIWSFIPPLNEINNKYYSNVAKNGLEFQSFACMIKFKNETAANLTLNMTKVENQSSGASFDGLSFDVLDTYGQSLSEFEQLTAEALSDSKICESFGENSSLCPFKTFISENEKQRFLYLNKSSIYQFKTPILYGKTILFRNKSAVNLDDHSFDLDATIINASPGFFVFVNISSPSFIFHKKNINNSKVYSFLKSKKIPVTLSEVRTPTSYSYIIPVSTRICAYGEYFDSEKNICELCRVNMMNYELNQTQCKPCKAGLICNGGMDISVKAGFWRQTNSSENIYECDKIKSSCLGGINSECGQNFDGQLCGACSQDIAKPPMEMNYSRKCKECPPTSSLLFVSISFFIILFAVIWVFARFFFENDQDSKRQWIVKSLINYFHTFLLLSSYNLDANFVFESYLVWVNRISQGVGFWFSMECITKFVINSSKFSIRFLFEITYFHIFIGLFLFMRHRRNKKRGYKNPKERLFEEVLFLWYFFYPSVLDYLMRICMCIDINDNYYLYVAPDEKCKTLENVLMLWFDVAFIFIWTLYGPYFILKSLKQQNEKKQQRLSKRQKSPSMSPTNSPSSSIIRPPNRNILLVDYKEKYWMIEGSSYTFKIMIYGIKASSLKCETKLLIIRPIVFYFQIFEIYKWKLFNLSLQKRGDLLISFNFILLSYGCLWLTIDGFKIFSDIFFFLSFFVQVVLFKIMFGAIGSLPLPKFLQKNKLFAIKRVKVLAKKSSVLKGNFFPYSNEIHNSNSTPELSSLKALK